MKKGSILLELLMSCIRVLGACIKDKRRVNWHEKAPFIRGTVFLLSIPNVCSRKNTEVCLLLIY
jgi:hypothetical protein